MTPLHVHRASPGGPASPLVLLHALGTNWRVWKPVLPALAAQHDVLAVDLPGFGESEPIALRPHASLTIAAVADAVEAELDARDIATAHLVGNSVGGWVALELATRGRARSVVALAPVGLGTPQENDRTRRIAEQGLAFARAVGPLGPALARRAVGRLVINIWAAAARRPWQMDGEDAAYTFATLMRSAAFEPLLDWILDNEPAGLERISCPVLVAWGTADRILPFRQGERFAQRIPGCELVELPGLGHLPMVDAPETVASLVLEFTARHERVKHEIRAGA
jgi:pimeloyl-ACP methyl ester carboxylesterase